MPFMKFRPNLYRTVRVVLSDGSTFRQPSAVRQVGEMLALERDTANHPVYLGLGDLSGMVDRREEARLLKIAQRRARREGVEEEEEWGVSVARREVCSLSRIVSARGPTHS